MREATCLTCGRRMPDGDPEARRCSKRCRQNKPNAVDHALEAAILDLLAAQPGGGTIDPAEAVMAVALEGPDALERARRAARRLVALGKAQLIQGGRVVDPSTAKGPVRIRGLRRG
jgi:hypothetical protein